MPIHVEDEELTALIAACEYAARACNANAVNIEKFFGTNATTGELRRHWFELETKYYNLRDTLREIEPEIKAENAVVA